MIQIKSKAKLILVVDLDLNTPKSLKSSINQVVSKRF